MKPLPARDLYVYQGDAPQITLRVQKKDVDGVVSNFSLAGYTITFIAKNSVDDTDAQAVITYLSSGVSPKITVTDEANGLLRIDFQAADLTTVRDLPYRLVISAGSTVRTVRRGTLFVQNT